MPLETLIWAVANEWKQVAQAANLTLNVNIERSGLYILGDERRLRWALGNIIDNAIKYTPPGGKVSLEIKDEEDGFARLRIRDNGVGIAADELPHVFTRFFRGHAGQRDRAGAARAGHRAGLDDCAADHRGARRADLRAQFAGRGDGGLLHAAAGESAERRSNLEIWSEAEAEYGSGGTQRRRWKFS